MSPHRGRLDWLELDSLPRGRPGELLRHTAERPHPPTGREVFVNRTLRMQTIRHVGFDLDWTLADYDRPRLDQLTFELAIDRLIDGHGYPESLRDLRLRPDFPCRGLLIDKQEGVVLRMDRHRYVGQAYLGRHRLGPAELIPLYRQNPVSPSSGRFYHVDSLFELPETNLFSELVERVRTGANSQLPDFPELFDEVRAAIDWVHRDGVMKRRVLARPELYLRRDPELALALDRFRLGERRLILITNSPWDYTDGVCSYLFDGLQPGLDSWRRLFDLVVVSASKPAFFRNGSMFVELAPTGAPCGEHSRPKWGGVYAGGSLTGLMELLDCPGEQVLYIGDHIYGDIVTSKTESTWRTALIVRELEREVAQRASMQGELTSLDEMKEVLAVLGGEMDQMGDMVKLIERIEADGGELPEGGSTRARNEFERLRAAHKRVLTKARRLADKTSTRFNRYWGSFFQQGNSKTLFAGQLERYACLYTSRVSNFGFYGSHHYYRVLSDPMQHERERTST